MERNGNLTFEAGGTIGAKCLCKLSSGEVVVVSAATDVIIGINQFAVVDGDKATVRPLNSQGTAELCAAGEIAVGALVVYKDDASGRVETDGSADNRAKIGIALEAATAAGDIIEVLLFPSLNYTAG